MPLITLLFEQIYLTQNDEMLVDLNSWNIESTPPPPLISAINVLIHLQKEITWAISWYSYLFFAEIYQNHSFYRK